MNLSRFTLIASILLCSSTFLACSTETDDLDEDSATAQDALKNKPKQKTCTVDDIYTNWVNKPGQRVYKVGDTFPAPDGCNTCACTENGVVCTKIGCNEPPPGGSSGGAKAPPIGKGK